MGARQPGGSPERRLRGADRARRAAELKLQGLTFREIAEQLGYSSKSGAAEAIEAYRMALPRAAMEQLRDEQLARCQRAQDSQLEDLKNRDSAVRARAAVAVARIGDTIARISGMVKVPAPVVQVHVDKTAEFDASRLTLEELQTLRSIRMKLAAPALEAHGDVVEQSTTKLEPEGVEDERDERSGDLGQE